MSMIINTNIASLNAQNNLAKSQSGLATSLERLSSGLRINSAKDDAAGLAIASRMTGQINGMNQAARNANDAISLAQTADGGLASISNNLQRMRELAVQSANATNSATDRAALQEEMGQLNAEIDRVASTSQFNGINLLDGSFSNQSFQVGANANQTISMGTIGSARTSALGLYNGFASTSLGAITNGAASALSVTLAGPGTTYNLGSIATDASAIANAVNQQGIKGLTATAAATVATGTTTTTGTAIGTASFTLNGLSISVANTSATAGSGGVGNRANALAAINAVSASTGVVASDNGSGLVLTAADGRNIAVAGFAAGTATASTLADFGLGGLATTTSTVSVSYQASAGSTVTGVTFSAGAGLAGSTVSVGSTGTALSAIDVTTAANATTALVAIDAALSAVNSERATLGAYQNRFSSAVDNLQTTSENLSASRARIQDADFAAETADMTRNQILQQAGVSVLSQANQAPQLALKLLQ